MKNNPENYERGVIITCPKTDCMYTWRYAGRFTIYATCPSCRRNVKLLDNRVKLSHSEKNDDPSHTDVIGNSQALRSKYNKEK